MNKLPRNTIKFKSKSFHGFYPVITFCIEACMFPLLISSSATVSTSSELSSEFISKSCSMLKSWQLYSSQATRTQSKNFLFQQMLNQLFRYMISHNASFGILIVGHEWKMIRHCNFVLEVQNYLPFIFSQLIMYVHTRCYFNLPMQYIKYLENSYLKKGKRYEILKHPASLVLLQADLKAYELPIHYSQHW